MQDKYITVSQLNRYLKYKFDRDENLNEIFIKGEISNFKAHSRGHYYFTLKDENSVLSAVMFSNAVKNIKFLPQDGMKVLITGKVSVFESAGSYQIYVEEMLEDGVGNLYIAFEQLKKKLEAEGLFKEDHKKKIPKIPNRIGVITAPTGAAIKDIISTIKRRWPLAEVYLFPSLVQGELAKDDIVKQIKRAEEFDLPLDTLIVGRGGGSIEDLWPFNEEIVARAIYDCKIPVISAVGHEVDFTISDFVADLRAPTPTGAAEMAVPQLNDVSRYLNQVELRCQNTMIHQLQLYRRKINDLMERQVFKNPMTMYQNKELVLDQLMDKLKYHFVNIVNVKEKDLLKIKHSIILQKPYQLLEKKKNVFVQNLSKLETLSPLLTLKRGYSMTRKDDKVVCSSKQLKKDDSISIEFQDGVVDAKVV